jgi:hypothetical protein
LKTLFIIVGLILLPIAGFIIYRLITVKNQRRKIADARFERIKPLMDKILNGNALTTDDVAPYAKNVLTREITFQLLSEHNQLDLFPKAYRTLIKGAESNLAQWLEFPTELDACPDEIEYIKRVTFDFDGENNFVHFEVFKFRVNEPHWAAKDGWILGVVGPYFDDSVPYDFPHSTFSRLSSTIDKVSPEEEARWVYENISNRK